VVGSLFSAPAGEQPMEVPQEIDEIALSRLPGPVAASDTQPPPAVHPGREQIPSSPPLPATQADTHSPAARQRPTEIPRIEGFTPLIAEIPRPSEPGARNESSIGRIETNIPSRFSRIEAPPAPNPAPQNAMELDSEPVAKPNPVGTLTPQPDQTLTAATDSQSSAESRSADLGQRVVVRQTYKPPVAGNADPIAESAQDRDRSSFSSPARGPALLRHAAKPEADEIQIHIGRIEVTAVTPAPVRPPAQPVRRALKLDEYLRRGRGSGS
jgi:hypothetical protein